MRNLLLGLLVIMLLVAVVHSITGKNDSPSMVAAKAADEAKWQTVFGGAITLRKAMRNPDSFKVSQALQTSEGSVCYIYRAQNGFGGMNVGHAVVFQNHLIDESGIGFSDVWSRECNRKMGTERAAEVNEGLKMVAASE